MSQKKVSKIGGTITLITLLLLLNNLVATPNESPFEEEFESATEYAVTLYLSEDSQTRFTQEEVKDLIKFSQENEDYFKADFSLLGEHSGKSIIEIYGIVVEPTPQPCTDVCQVCIQIEMAVRDGAIGLCNSDEEGCLAGCEKGNLICQAWCNGKGSACRWVAEQAYKAAANLCCNDFDPCTIDKYKEDSNTCTYELKEDCQPTPSPSTTTTIPSGCVQGGVCYTPGAYCCANNQEYLCSAGTIPQGSINLPECQFADSAGVWAKPKDCNWNHRVSFRQGGQESCTYLILKHSIFVSKGPFQGFVKTWGPAAIGESTDLCAIDRQASMNDLPKCPFSGNLGDVWAKPNFKLLVPGFSPLTWEWDTGKCKLGTDCVKKYEFTIPGVQEQVPGITIEIGPFTFGWQPEVGTIGLRVETHANTPGRVYSGTKNLVVLTGTSALDLCVIKPAECTPGECNTKHKRYCFSTGTWSDYEAPEYCNNCNHCGDGICNCGETEASCLQDCEPEPEYPDCVFTDCDQANTVPCWCGGGLNPKNNPWCCDKGSFAGGYTTQESCLEKSPCGTCNDYCTLNNYPKGGQCKLTCLFSGWEHPEGVSGKCSGLYRCCCRTSSASYPYVNSVTISPQVPSTSATFEASGANIEQIRVYVYDVGDSLLFDSNWQPSTTYQWNLVDNSGNKLEKGTYSYKIGVKCGNIEDESVTNQVNVDPQPTTECPYLKSVKTEPMPASTTITFEAIGANIEQIKVQVFDQSGHPMYFDSGWQPGTTYQWDLVTKYGNKLGTGTYLYRVYVKGCGKVKESALKKFTVFGEATTTSQPTGPSCSISTQTAQLTNSVEERVTVSFSNLPDRYLNKGTGLRIDCSSSTTYSCLLTSPSDSCGYNTGVPAVCSYHQDGTYTITATLIITSPYEADITCSKTITVKIGEEEPEPEPEPEPDTSTCDGYCQATYGTEGKCKTYIPGCGSGWFHPDVTGKCTGIWNIGKKCCCKEKLRTCVDSDKGQDKYTKGTATIYKADGTVASKLPDYCSSNLGAVYEAYCIKESGLPGETLADRKAMECDPGEKCQNDACTKQPTGEYTCDDTDGGSNKNVRGTVTVYKPDGSQYKKGTDSCITGTNKVKEYTCPTSSSPNPFNPSSVDILCSNGCYQGACKEEAEPSTCDGYCQAIKGKEGQCKYNCGSGWEPAGTTGKCTGIFNIGKKCCCKKTESACAEKCKENDYDYGDCTDRSEDGPKCFEEYPTICVYNLNLTSSTECEECWCYDLDHNCGSNLDECNAKCTESGCSGDSTAAAISTESCNGYCQTTYGKEGECKLSLLGCGSGWFHPSISNKCGLLQKCCCKA